MTEETVAKMFQAIQNHVDRTNEYATKTRLQREPLVSLSMKEVRLLLDYAWIGLNGVGT